MIESLPRALPPPPDPAGTAWDAIDPRAVLDYDANTGTYRASFDSDRETICEALLLVVAAVSGTDPLELPSLPPVLDTDAVERLIDPSVTGSSSGDLRVSFTFADCDVTIHSYGIITVRPLHEASIG
jgi:hypothetical protein